MIKKNVITLSLLCMLPLSAYSTGADIKNNSLGVDKNKEVISHDKYKNHSELAEDIGQKQLLKMFDEKMNVGIEAISRIGDEDKDTEIRKDVLKYINSIDLKKNEKKLLMNFAKYLQSLMFLETKEFVNIKALTYIRTGMLSNSMCVIKERKDDVGRKDLYLMIKQVEKITLNTKERKEHYNTFEEFSNYVASVEESFVPTIFLTSYKTCFGKRGTKQELEDTIKAIKKLNAI